MLYLYNLNNQYSYVQLDPSWESLKRSNVHPSIIPRSTVTTSIPRTSPHHPYHPTLDSNNIGISTKLSTSSNAITPTIPHATTTNEHTKPITCANKPQQLL